ncbi:MAG: AraC family ligand binding domain-containing protein, partial [Clostridiales bacterium]|nr:AraC family ligand binding domain-containing protein [Clostridiales bacterium]
MELDFNNMIPELHYYIHRKCTPTWKIEPATIHFIDITYVIAGKADYAIGEERLSVRKGDLICIPKNTYRAAVCVPDDLMECYSINFFLRDRAGIDVAFPIPVKTHIGIEPELISSFHKIYEIWLQKNFGYMLQITSIQCE